MVPYAREPRKRVLVARLSDNMPQSRREHSFVAHLGELDIGENKRGGVSLPI